MIEVGDDDNLAISTKIPLSLIRFLQNFEYVELWGKWNGLGGGFRSL